MSGGEARSNGPRSLADSFRRLIRTTGPISLSQFMGESNARYYAGKDPLGTSGDFITAPEISQMFGELIGLWLADIWMRAGQPERVHYVELGPGRGTLAKDALRSSAQFGLKPQAHLVEGSPALRAAQGATIPEAVWHDDLTSVPIDGPMLLVANEFFDALPVRQLVRSQNGWRERMVGLEGPDGEDFAFVAGEQDMAPAVPEQFAGVAESTILETCPGAAAIMHEICERLKTQGGAALLIDYGHSAPRTGSTLQALRNHKMLDPLSAPGEADLTAHVDFATLAEIAEASETKMLGTVPQGDWLKAMGIEARAQKLAAASPDHADDLASAVDRLTAEDQMGQLFKVMGIAAPDWPAGAGFGQQ